MNELDPFLSERFRSEHTQLAPEPFLSVTLRRVEAERARARTRRYIGQAIALIGVIWASPWLVQASTLLSARLDGLFAKASWLFHTPIGMGIAALGMILGAALFRGRTSR